MSTTTDISSLAPTNTNSELSSMPTLSAGDFMQILVAEFQNQDPTDPTDPTTYATQLVDFANLGQLQNIDTAVQPSNSTSLMQAASAFIGREVVTPGSSIGVQSGAATSIAFAPSATDSYTALIANAAGQQVAAVSLGQLQAGSSQSFTWKPSSSIADGSYTVNIVGAQAGAQSGLLEQGVVQNVSMTSSGVNLNLGNLVIPETAIAEVAQPTN
ncbi:MAG TPA: flagellar hook capping FlgD N-terminal domain-containing protein [Candidatus Binataceae bacterium]|nr:flagellar hook capping FlgD N-terminal domain-containing protein [Candidatus Binataceae bacterium]